ATLVLFSTYLGFEGGDLAVVPILFTVVAGALMVSHVNYYSFKDLHLGQRVSFTVLLIVPLVFIVISINPPVVLFLMAFTYAISGPAIQIWRWLRRRRNAEQA